MMTDGGFRNFINFEGFDSMSQGDPISRTFFFVATFGKHKVPDMLCLPGI